MVIHRYLPTNICGKEEIMSRESLGNLNGFNNYFPYNSILFIYQRKMNLSKIKGCNFL